MTLECLKMYLDVPEQHFIGGQTEIGEVEI